jgi:hypothetical protein
MKKSRLLGAVCACLFASCLSTSTHAALLVGEDTSGNFVTNIGSGPGNIAVEIDFVNLDPVWLLFDPQGVPFEDMVFRINNLTGLFWTDFHIEYANSDPFNLVFFDVPIIIPDTDPTFDFQIGLNDNTGLPNAGWIFFNTPEGSGLWIEAVTDTVVDPFALFSITLQPTVIPIPAAVWLFGTGLLGLIGISRRRKIAKPNQNKHQPKLDNENIRRTS